MDNLRHPEHYPLTSQIRPVITELINAATVMYGGDWVRALSWIQKPVWALGGILLIYHQDTPEQIQAVLDLIGRIARGVLS